MHSTDSTPQRTRDEAAAQPWRASDATEMARVQVELAPYVADLAPMTAEDAPLALMIDIGQVLQTILLAVHALVRADASALRLYDAGGHALVPEAQRDLPESLAGPVELSAPGLHAAAAKTLEPVFVADLDAPGARDAFDGAPDAGSFRAALVLPLTTVGGELMGTLACYFARTPALEERDRRLVEAYARQAGELIERARLQGHVRDLAARERRRSAQLRLLADTAQKLNPKTSMEEVLRIVTERAVEVIGTHQGVTTHLVNGWTEAKTHVLLSEKYAAYRNFDEVPKGLGVLTYVTRENKPLRLNGEQLRVHPDWRGLRDAPAHPPLPDYLAAPLIGSDGQNIGLIQLSDKVDGTEFSEEDEAILVQLAQMASIVIENAALIERERTLRAQAEEQARLRGILSDAGRAFASSLEPEDTLRAIVRACVPELADWAAVRIAEPDGEIRLAAVRGASETIEAGVRRVLERFPVSLDQPYGPGAAIRTGESHLVPTVDDAILQAMAADEQQLADLRLLNARSGICVPLTTGEQMLGALSIARIDRAPFTETELEFAEDLAQRAALALRNATQFALEREVAARLQQSLLPASLPQIGCLTAAGRYRPAAGGAQIGGDWYDVIDLGGSRVGLVVGDVMGRGIEAATIMGQLRSAVRAYALEGHPPQMLLPRLDRLVQALGAFQLTTCLYAVFDSEAATLTVASAGHVPPVLVPVDGPPRFLTLEPNLPLGIGGDRFEHMVVPLAPGDVVLLFTDGLVEGPDSPVDEGAQQLLRAAGERAQTPGELCDRILTALRRDGDHDDDVAILAVAVTGETAARRASRSLTLPPEPRSASLARAALAALLREGAGDGTGEAAEAATLLVSELVTNAVRHARTDLRVDAWLTKDRLRVEVLDGADGVPEIRTADAGRDEWGRGVFLVDALAERWGCVRLPHGKRVWFEVTLHPTQQHTTS